MPIINSTSLVIFGVLVLICLIIWIIPDEPKTISNKLEKLQKLIETGESEAQIMLVLEEILCYLPGKVGTVFCLSREGKRIEKKRSGGEVWGINEIRSHLNEIAASCI